MRKTIFTVLLATVAIFSQAQTVEDALKQLDKNKLDQAKASIDKLTADPASKNAEAWFAKSLIYNAIAIDDKLKSTVPDAYDQAFEAYRKAYDLDPNNKRMMLDLNKAIFVSYEGLTAQASDAYKNNDFENAFKAYKNVLEKGAYLNSKNITYSGYFVPKVDTAMVFMAGYTAMKLEKADEAAQIFTKFADAGIHTEPDYVIPYQFLSYYYYKTKKDEANFKKYSAMGREFYPKDQYFITIALDNARDNNNYTELFKGYDKLISENPDSLGNYISYASEMFNYLYKDVDKKPADYDAVVSKIESSIKKTLDNGYDLHNSHLILGQLYYNQGLDYSTEMDNIRGTKPDDVKKKNDFKAKAVEKYTQAIPHIDYLATEYEKKGTLKLGEKATLKDFYNKLSYMYSVKGDKAKADEYSKKEANAMK